jgi:hypothetical protein
VSVTKKKKDLKRRKKAKPIFTKNYIFANSINFFFMEMLIQQKKVWTKEKDGRAADTIHQQCKKLKNNYV